MCGLRRRLARWSALIAVFVAAVPLASAAARRTADPPFDGFERLLVATDRPGEDKRVARSVESVGGRPVRLLRGPGVLAVQVPRSTAPALSRRLERTRGIRFVERNRFVMRTTEVHLPEWVPTDPLWPHQWGAKQIGAPAVWALTRGSPKIVVATVDTGVDPTQPDLQGALVRGYNTVDGTDDPEDDNGHGTRTAGIVGARANNGIGISGVCPRCSIMPVKVAGENGSSSALDFASGITWATDHGAAVISLSLGGGPSETVAAAIRYAQQKGVLVIAAAGNNRSSQPFYPAADAGVLSVAGTDPDGHLYGWSDYGNWVAVAAPGCDTTTLTGDGYGRFCGTSASAPIVAGLAGLALSYSPKSSAERIERAIISSAHPLDGVAAGSVHAIGTLAALGAKFERCSGRECLRPAGRSGPR